MFSLFKKNKARKEVNDMANTVDEKDIEKAKEDIAEKGKDSQTERDREDESVAAQLKAEGKEDSQTAKDRIDESEGAKKADEKKAAERDDHEERMSRMESKLDSLSNLIEGINATIGKLMSARDEDERHLDRAKAKYGVGNSVFESEDAERKITPAEAAAVVNSLKI